MAVAMTSLLSMHLIDAFRIAAFELPPQRVKHRRPVGADAFFDNVADEFAERTIERIRARTADVHQVAWIASRARRDRRQRQGARQVMRGKNLPGGHDRVGRVFTWASHDGDVRDADNRLAAAE